MSLVSGRSNRGDETLTVGSGCCPEQRWAVSAGSEWLQAWPVAGPGAVGVAVVSDTGLGVLDRASGASSAQGMLLPRY